MNKHIFKKIFGIGIPVMIAAVTALSDEINSRKQEEKMEEMENRITELEKAKEV